jgi:segregation and condensation protein B
MDIAARELEGLGESSGSGSGRLSGGAGEPEPLEPEPFEDEPAGSEPRAEDSSDADASETGTPVEAAALERLRLGPGQQKSDEELSQELFVLLFASPEPLGLSRLVELLLRPEPERVRAALARVAERLAQAGLPLVPRELAGGWRLLSDPEYADVLQRLKKEPKPERISSAALETLAIVAYRQPVTKAEVEAIRGVQSGPLLRALVDRGLVRVSGRADQPGSPLQYATTREFLDRFGLASLKDLPRDGELTAD